MTRSPRRDPAYIPETGDQYRDSMLNQIARHEILTFEDEKRLGSIIRAHRDPYGDAVDSRWLEREFPAYKEAVDCFWINNQRWVYKIAGHESQIRASGLGLNIGDLFEACLSYGQDGLLRAIEEYDPSKGYRFSTYAKRWIQNSIQRYIANYETTIRLPVHVFDSIPRVRRIQAAYLDQHGHWPGDMELARLARVSIDVIHGIRYANTFSLDAPLNDEEDENTNMYGSLSAGSEVEHEVGTRSLAEQVHTILDGYERRGWGRAVRYLKLYHGLTPEAHGETLTFEAIGQQEGLTRERIRQVIFDLKQDIRHHHAHLAELLKD